METISILKKYRFFDSSSNDFTTKHYVNPTTNGNKSNSNTELVPINTKLETSNSNHASMYNWGYAGGGTMKQPDEGEVATKRLINNTNRPITTIGRQNSFYVNKQSLIKPNANSSNNILFKLSTNLNRTSPSFESSTPVVAKSNKLVPINVVNMNNSSDFKTANQHNSNLMISSSYFNNYFTNSALTNFDNNADSETNYAKLIRKNSNSNAVVRGPYQKSAKPVRSAKVNFKSASSYLDSNKPASSKKQPVFTNYYFYNNASSSPSSSSNNNRLENDPMNEEKKKALITNYLKRSMAKWSTSNNPSSPSKFNSMSSTKFSNKSYSNLNKLTSKNTTNSSYFNDINTNKAENLESSSLVKSNNNFQTSVDLTMAEAKFNLLKIKRPGSRQNESPEVGPVSPPPPRPKSRSQMSVRVKTATRREDDKSVRKEETVPIRATGKYQPVIAERKSNQPKEVKTALTANKPGNYDMSVNITSINENIKQRMKLTGENGDAGGADDDNIDWAAEEQAYLANVNKKCNEWLEKYVLPFLDVAARQPTSSPSSSSMFDESPFLN